MLSASDCSLFIVGASLGSTASPGGGGSLLNSSRGFSG
jgi:hypothetical protein